MKPSIKRCSFKVRGALRRELTACLRTGRVLRMPRARTRGREQDLSISPEIMISQRRERRQPIAAVPGHREGDLILGRGSSAIGTFGGAHDALHSAAIPAAHGGAMATRFRVKNGPALAGHEAEAVRDAITRTIVTLPGAAAPVADLGSRRAEMAQHARLKIEAGV